MKNIFDIYESILDDDFDQKSNKTALTDVVEQETGWTLSSDGKYILSGTKHFPGNINTYLSNNREWFENLVNCAKKYKLKIQPLGLVVLNEQSIHLLEDVDIEYICELKIYVDNPVNVDLSKIKSPIQRIKLEEQRGSYCDINSITLQKTPVITTHIDLYTWEGLQNVKNMNCFNLIINDSRWAFLLNPKTGLINSNNLQQFVDNNPNVTNFYIRTTEKRREK